MLPFLVYWVVLLFKLLRLTTLKEIFYRFLGFIRYLPILGPIYRYLELIGYRFRFTPFFYLRIFRPWMGFFVLWLSLTGLEKLGFWDKITMFSKFDHWVLVPAFLFPIVYCFLFFLSKYTRMVLLEDFEVYLVITFAAGCIDELYEPWGTQLALEYVEMDEYLNKFLWVDWLPLGASLENYEAGQEFFGEEEEYAQEDMGYWLDGVITTSQEYTLIGVSIFVCVLCIVNAILSKYYFKEFPVKAVPYLGNRVLGDNYYEVELFIRQFRWLLKHRPMDVSSFVSLRLEDYMMFEVDEDEVAPQPFYSNIDDVWLDEEFEEEDELDFMEEYEHMEENNYNENDPEYVADARVFELMGTTHYDYFTQLWAMDDNLIIEDMEAVAGTDFLFEEPELWNSLGNLGEEFESDNRFVGDEEMDFTAEEPDEFFEMMYMDQYEDEYRYLPLESNDEDPIFTESIDDEDFLFTDDFINLELEMNHLDYDIYYPMSIEELTLQSEDAIHILFWRYKWLLVRSYFQKHGFDLAGSSYRHFLNIVDEKELTLLEQRLMSIYSKELLPYVSMFPWTENFDKWIRKDIDELTEDMYFDGFAERNPGDPHDDSFADHYVDPNITYKLMHDLVHGGLSDYRDWRFKLSKVVGRYEKEYMFLLSVKPESMSLSEMQAVFEKDLCDFYNSGVLNSCFLLDTAIKSNAYRKILSNHNTLYEGFNSKVSLNKAIDFLETSRDDLQLRAFLSEELNEHVWDTDEERFLKVEARILHTFENEHDHVLMAYLELYANSGFMEVSYYKLFSGLLESSFYDVYSGRAFVFLDFYREDVCFWFPLAWNLGLFHSKEMEPYTMPETTSLIKGDPKISRELSFPSEDHLYYDWIRSSEIAIGTEENRLWLDEYRAKADVIEKELVSAYVAEYVDYEEAIMRRYFQERPFVHDDLEEFYYKVDNYKKARYENTEESLLDVFKYSWGEKNTMGVVNFFEDDIETPRSSFGWFEDLTVQWEMINQGFGKPWGWDEDYIYEQTVPNAFPIGQYEQYIVNSVYEKLFIQWGDNALAEILSLREELFHEDMMDYSAILIGGWELDGDPEVQGHLVTVQPSPWIENGNYPYDFDLRQEIESFRNDHLLFLLNVVPLDLLEENFKLTVEDVSSSYEVNFWNNLKSSLLSNFRMDEIQLRLFFLYHKDQVSVVNNNFLVDEAFSLSRDNLFKAVSVREELEVLEDRVGIKFNDVIYRIRFDLRFRLPFSPLVFNLHDLDRWEEEEVDLDDWQFVADDVVTASFFDPEELFFTDTEQYRKGWLLSTMRLQHKYVRPLTNVNLFMQDTFFGSDDMD